MMNHESDSGVTENRSQSKAGLTGRGSTHPLTAAVEKALGRTVTAVEACPGGDINLAFRIELEGGTPAFLKCRSGARTEEFIEEAAGLRWLAEAEGLPVPGVLAVLDDDSCPGLMLEWLEAGRSLSGEGWQELGRGLAAVHLAGAEFHGQRPGGASVLDLRLGDALLVAPCEGRRQQGFAELYATRIEALAAQALSGGGLDREGAAAISRLAGQIEHFAGPPVPPARLHGDLWSGNVMADLTGRPWLIDPAPYGGHPEVDLAMLDLFGSPPPGFIAAYGEVAPLPDGAAERTRLWQIQPLLVHAVLFGGHYGASAARAAAGYTG